MPISKPEWRYRASMSHADFAYIDLFISAQIYESRIEVIDLAWRFVSQNSARRCK